MRNIFSSLKWPVSAWLAVASLSLVSAVTIVGIVRGGSIMPIGTALVGAGSVIAGAWLAGRWQIRQIRAELQLTNRSTAYLRLAEFLVRLRQEANTAASTADSLDHLAIDTDDWWSLQAQIEAFASTSVRQAFGAILTTRVRFRTAYQSWIEERDLPPGVRPGSAGLDKLDERRQEVLIGCQELFDTINEELSADNDTEN